MLSNYADLISPISGRVRESVLYDMASEFHNNWLPATVVGILSYDRNLPTLKVLVKDTAIFDYVPLDCFVVGFQREETDNIPREHLTPFQCQGHLIAIDTVQKFKRPVRVFLGPNKEFHDGNYICSLDWPEGNVAGSLVHLIGSNLLAIVPNHRLLFGEAGELPDYKKLRAEFK